MGKTPTVDLFPLHTLHAGRPDSINKTYGSIEVDPLFSSSTGAVNTADLIPKAAPPAMIWSTERSSQLGAGTYGIVQRMAHTKSGHHYAVKILDTKILSNNGLLSQLKNEMEAHHVLDHPNIIKCYGVEQDRTHVHIILELAEKGDLYDALRRQPFRRFNEEEAFYYFAQLVNGLYHIHSRNIFHRDIKLENILLMNDGSLRIADFGWSAPILAERQHFNFCGTLEYLAPEMAQAAGHDWRVDLWSAGVVLYELLAGHSPFQSATVADLLTRMYKVEFDWPSCITPDVRSTITKLLQYHREHRLPLNELRKDGWVRRMWSRFHHRAENSGLPQCFLTAASTVDSLQLRPEPAGRKRVIDKSTEMSSVTYSDGPGSSSDWDSDVLGDADRVSAVSAESVTSVQKVIPFNNYGPRIAWNTQRGELFTKGIGVSSKQRCNALRLLQSRRIMRRVSVLSKARLSQSNCRNCDDNKTSSSGFLLHNKSGTTFYKPRTEVPNVLSYQRSDSARFVKPFPSCKEPSSGIRIKSTISTLFKSPNVCWPSANQSHSHRHLDKRSSVASATALPKVTGIHQVRSCSRGSSDSSDVCRTKQTGYSWLKRAIPSTTGFSFNTIHKNRDSTEISSNTSSSESSQEMKISESNNDNAFEFAVSKLFNFVHKSFI